MLATGAVAELRERNAIFGDPSERVDGRGRVPHAVPGAVLVAVVIDGHVHLHASRVDTELVARSAVVVRVEEDPDHVGRRVRVASLEQLDDAVGMRIVRANEDVQVRGVIGNLRDRLEAWLLALGWTPHEKLRELRCGLPDGVVVLAVDHRRDVSPHGAHAAIGGEIDGRGGRGGDSGTSDGRGWLLRGLNQERAGQQRRGDEQHGGTPMAASWAYLTAV